MLIFSVSNCRQDKKKLLTVDTQDVGELHNHQTDASCQGNQDGREGVKDPARRLRGEVVPYNGGEESYEGRCSCNKTMGCMVRVTLNMIEIRLVRFHNHNTNLLADTVKNIIDKKMETVQY